MPTTFSSPFRMPCERHSSPQLTPSIVDFSVVTEVEIRRRWLRTTFSLNAVSPVLAAGLALGSEFVYVALSDAPAQDVLP
jgi:hypothetical protein